MSKIAFIFPGQGSQSVGMGQDVYNESPLARQILDQANEVLGINLTRLCFEGPKEELNLTINTQPALLAVSYALYKLLEAEGITPEIVAGHSLGEYTALLAAGSILYEDALKLVRERARLMQEACAPGVGAMAAIVGLERDLALKICREASSDEGVVEAANFNCPGQIVVSGHKGAVQRAVELAKQKGAKLAVELAVSIPSHCSLMKEAGGELGSYLDKLSWQDLSVPLVTNVDARIVTNTDQLKAALVKQLSFSVYWEDSVKKMLKEGVDTFIEVGPGNVLAKLLKRIDRKVKCYSVSNSESLNKIISDLINGS